MLFLIEEPKGDRYKNLIKYACKNNNIVELDTRDCFIDKSDKEVHEKFNLLCSLLNKTKQEIRNEYMRPGFIDEVYNVIKNYEDTPWKEDVEEGRFVHGPVKSIKKRREIVFKKSLDFTMFSVVGIEIYEEKMNKIIDNLRESLIKIECESKESKKIIARTYSYNRYYFRIDKKVEEFLLSIDKLFDLSFSENPENIAFYKDDKCWLDTISHEEMCGIYPNDSNEIKYLEDIGIEYIIEKDSEFCR